jgi:hypothetical protein
MPLRVAIRSTCDKVLDNKVMFVPFSAAEPPTRNMAGPPSSITKAVLAFCGSIRHASKPVYLPIRPEPGSVVRECFDNVRRKVEREGGRIQFGWEIYQWPGVYIEGEHHAVYEGPNGPPWLDITPAPEETPQQTRLFLPDDSAIYEFDNPTFRRDNIRKALAADLLIDEFLGLASELVDIMRRTPGTGMVTVEGADAERLEVLARRSAELKRQIAMKYTAWDARCSCGRPEKFKRCHGSPQQRHSQR